MLKDNSRRVHVGRRDFIKTTTMAGMAAGFPGALAQDSESVVKPVNRGNKRKLLLLTDNPKGYERLILQGPQELCGMAWKNSSGDQ